MTYGAQAIVRKILRDEREEAETRLKATEIDAINKLSDAERRADHPGPIEFEADSTAWVRQAAPVTVSHQSTCKMPVECANTAKDGAVPTSESRLTATVTHTTKTPRRDTLTPVIELAKNQCRKPKDTAEVWACLLMLAESKSPPLIGATEEGLQYLKNGMAAIFKRDALRKRLAR